MGVVKNDAPYRDYSSWENCNNPSYGSTEKLFFNKGQNSTWAINPSHSV